MSKKKGNDQPDLLKSMLYEQGLIPLIKPIVFNALVWIVLRQPNFKTVRDHIREFEDNNGLPF